MDLAEKIISRGAAGEEAPWGELDRYGLPLKYSGHVDYTVARIIIRHPDICLNPNDGRIYLLDDIRREPIKEDSRTVVELANFASPFRGERAVLVFNRLKELLPKVDTKSMLVGDGLVFDGETKTLKETLTMEQTEARYRDVTSLLNELENKERKDD